MMQEHPLQKAYNEEGTCSYKITYRLPLENDILEGLKKDGSTANKGAGIAWFFTNISLPQLEDFENLDKADHSPDGTLIYGSSGYTLLRNNFIEMLKNSITANATHAQCEFMIDHAEDKVHLTFRDNQTSIMIGNEVTTLLRQKAPFSEHLVTQNRMLLGKQASGLTSPIVRVARSQSAGVDDSASNLDSSLPKKESISGSNLGIYELSKSCVKHNCELILTSEIEQAGERATFHFICDLNPEKNELNYDASSRPKFASGRLRSLSTHAQMMSFSELIITPSTAGSGIITASRSANVSCEVSPEPAASKQHNNSPVGSAFAEHPIKHGLFSPEPNSAVSVASSQSMASGFVSATPPPSASPESL
jgi:hypothetical protein